MLSEINVAKHKKRGKSWIHVGKSTGGINLAKHRKRKKSWRSGGKSTRDKRGKTQKAWEILDTRGEIHESPAFTLFLLPSLASIADFDSAHGDDDGYNEE
jgi:hypothetical protein